ncbi:FidL-like protein [Lelliottia nimipressuralis]|uniref:FidL-like protein n=1 Tax=Lelliottia nimipressuralis TaxID=69220 RepID=UPI001E2ED28C|nr:FidL-like protein [Lelliottia nimipressuralis]MCD4562274.1 FidL-like protein [Lelliottia nimipressuralis]
MMIKKWRVAALGGICAVIAAFAFMPSGKAIPTLKCKAFSTVKMDVENGQLVFSIVESLQFYDKDKGIIQYEGYVKSPKGSTYLERTVYLTQGVEVDNKTYHFTIDKVTPSPLDVTPDADFDQMWLEITGDNASLNLGVRQIRDKTYVISSPYSPQFVCVTY